jgi:hypothetical protein
MVGRCAPFRQEGLRSRPRQVAPPKGFPCPQPSGGDTREHQRENHTKNKTHYTKVEFTKVE